MVDPYGLGKKLIHCKIYLSCLDQTCVTLFTTGMCQVFWLNRTRHVTSMQASDWIEWDRTAPYAEARNSAQNVLVNSLHKFSHFQCHWIFCWAKIQMKICLKTVSVKLALFTINWTMDLGVLNWSTFSIQCSMIYIINQYKIRLIEWIMIQVSLKPTRADAEWIK